jgi:predicted aldo/keto reductase-like oxidoreductase
MKEEADMADRNAVDRREFLITSAGVMAAGLGQACSAATPEEIERAAARVGTLPRRTLGSTGREITVLVGAATWSADAALVGIRCGVNYWHKAEDWGGNVPQAILKKRDAHYCQVCVDRVRGNHERGQIEEETHYQFVKSALEQTGLRYFDDMQFHFGYHNVAELKSNRGFVRAFERLKKEGLVHHLCLSQHHYAGNSRVEDGQNAAEILAAVIEEGVYEHAQFMYSYGEAGGMEQMVRLARRKGFGTIAMKTTRGAGRMKNDAEFMKHFPADTSPHHALARWLTTATELDAAVVQIKSLSEFVDTFSGAGKPVRAADARAIEKMTAYAGREVCRLCNECASHCQHGIPIADILRYERYAQDYGEGLRARVLYAMLDRQGNSCIACGNCLPHCTQQLEIPRKLAEAHEILAIKG